MTLDLDKYRSRKDSIKFILDQRTPESRLDQISEASVATGCHIVCVCYFCGELYGFTPELMSLIGRLCKFYKISRVIGEVRRDIQ